MSTTQTTLFRTSGDPVYNSNDEILRLSAELRFEQTIDLDECCGREPESWFRSASEYFMQCPICKKRTPYYTKTYKAMQAWNRGEFLTEDQRSRRGDS